MEVKIPCVIMRGGTSKALFFHRKDLPPRQDRCDAVILAAFGSPDKRQIDGLGGADPLTSKVAVISPSTRPDADVEYTFGQVGIGDPVVNYTASCGNVAAAVGPFAVDEGLIPAQEPLSRIRIFNTNTQKIIVAYVPVRRRRALSTGHFVIHGVPGSGAEIRLEFLEPSGAITGRLFPTGTQRETVRLSRGRAIDITVVDAGSVYAFVSARELGLSGAEAPDEIEARKDVMVAAEEIRRIASLQMVGRGAVDPPNGEKMMRSLKVALVGQPSRGQGTMIAARIVNPGKVHQAYAVTGAIALGAAAMGEHTVVRRELEKPIVGGSLVLEHPAGVMQVDMKGKVVEGQCYLRSATIRRTARRIMEGFVYVPRGLFAEVGKAATVEST